MKVRVIKRFVDRYTGDHVAVGKELEITKERFGELVAGPRTPFVEKIKEEPQKVEPTDKEPTDKEPTDKEPTDKEPTKGSVDDKNSESVKKAVEDKKVTSRPPRPSNARNKNK